MTRELRCADVGMKDCGWVGKGSTDDEVLKAAAAHAAKYHNLTKFDEATLAKVKAAIYTV
jgi:predicted small metal-binding protein